MISNTDFEITAIFTELPDGRYQLSTDGIQGINVVVSTFKEGMLQLVQRINLLKKEHQLPADFNLASQIKIEVIAH